MTPVGAKSRRAAAMRKAEIAPLEEVPEDCVASSSRGLPASPTSPTALQAPAASPRHIDTRSYNSYDRDALERAQSFRDIYSNCIF